MKTIELGDRVKDAISGLTGIATGVTDWLYGCRRIGVQPEKLGKDGKTQECVWFDEPQLIVTKAKAIRPPALLPATGGPDRHEEKR